MEISDELKDLISNLLIKEAKFRLGAKNDSKEIKNHPWFNNFNWKDL